MLEPINVCKERHVWPRDDPHTALTADVRKEIDLFICHHVPLNRATREALKICAAAKAISVVNQPYRAAYKAVWEVKFAQDGPAAGQKTLSNLEF